MTSLCKWQRGRPGEAEADDWDAQLVGPLSNMSRLAWMAKRSNGIGTGPRCPAASRKLV